MGSGLITIVDDASGRVSLSSITTPTLDGGNGLSISMESSHRGRMPSRCPDGVMGGVGNESVGWIGSQRRLNSDGRAVAESGTPWGSNTTGEGMGRAEWGRSRKRY